MSLVPEDVEADLEAQVTATHEVGHSEESGARYAGKTGGRSESDLHNAVLFTNQWINTPRFPTLAL